MSVISSPVSKPRRWLHLWPLALFFVVSGWRRALAVAGMAAGDGEKRPLAAGS